MAVDNARLQVHDGRDILEREGGDLIARHGADGRGKVLLHDRSARRDDNIIHLHGLFLQRKIDMRRLINQHTHIGDAGRRITHRRRPKVIGTRGEVKDEVVAVQIA